MFDELTILAPGLLGGSLMAAAHTRKLAARVTAWARREETRTACAAQPWCDRVYDSPEEAASKADCVILCAPVNIIPELLERVAPHLQEGTLVTDVGSTKGSLCEACEALMPSYARFIGSHPMAGSEKTGLEHADPYLFEGRPCILTPTERTPRAALSTLKVFWKQLGMSIHEASPEEHDRIVAHISHLPHFAAAALSKSLAQTPEAWASLAGQGLRDTTRIAAGDPTLWRAIFEDNKAEVLKAVAGLESEITTLKEALQNGDSDALIAALKEAQGFRTRF